MIWLNVIGGIMDVDEGCHLKQYMCIKHIGSMTKYILCHSIAYLQIWR